MTERSHADHRPRVDQDPSTLGDPPPGVTLGGQFYPRDDMLAVIDDRTAAEGAVQALKEAGVSEEDVDLVDGTWFGEAIRGMRERRGVLARLATLLPTDESMLVRRYVEEADRGHSIIVVHAEQPEEVTRAAQVLRGHGAYGIRHYGRHVITDL